MFTIHDSLGIIGVLLTLCAYFLLSCQKTQADSYLYVILNLVGSIFILESLYMSWNLSAFMMEVAWLSISLYALYNVYTQDEME